MNLYEELEPDYGQLLAGWFLDIDSIYEDAKQNVPSQNVLDVYEAYKKVQTALLFGYDEDFVKACEGFEAVLDVYNALSEDDLNTLAVLMGLGNGEEAFNQILCDWINANIILELGAVYDEGVLRSIAHCLEFMGLSVLLFNAVYVTWFLKLTPIIAFLGTVFYAITDEIHQIFVPERAFQTSDILVDSTGALIGVIASFIILKVILYIMKRGNKNGNS